MTPEQLKKAQTLLLDRLVSAGFAGMETALTYRVATRKLLDQHRSEAAAELRKGLLPDVNELLEQLQKLEVTP